MPEIAEVALMALAIREISLGHKIQGIEILGGRYAKKPLENLEKLQSECPLEIKAVKTKGKRCWLELGSENEIKWYILISFGMSGAIYYEPDSDEPEARKHFHIRVSLGPGKCFYFGDMRQFGSWKLFQQRSDLDQILDKLGPDMLTGPQILDSQFIEIFRKARFRQKNICKVLMSQEAVSGLGNYLKAEALYRTKINPWAVPDNLSDQKLTELHGVIRELTSEAFQGRGASLYTFTGVRREKGDFQNRMRVYGRTTDPDGHTVIRDKTPDQRTTHWVPEVQTVGVDSEPVIRKTPSPIIKKIPSPRIKKIPSPVVRLRTENVRELQKT